MTAPDYRPYLLPTDLRTPEDVLACVINFAVDPDIERDATDVFSYLSARLDRERRQACRRGALAMWRDFSDCARDLARRMRDEGLICDTESEDWAEWLLSNALAFRAAARQP